MKALILAGMVLILTSSLFVVANQRRAHLREEIRLLREQIADLESLREEHERLLTMQAEMVGAVGPTSDERSELLKLRAEANQLRGRLAGAPQSASVLPDSQLLPGSPEHLIYVDQYSGIPLDTPEHPRLRPTYELAKRGELAAVKKALDENPEFLHLPVGHAGATILHTAALNGQPLVVEELLRRKANVNVLNKAGQTPLHNSIERGNRDSALLLLQAGADVSIKANDGLTPLELAITRRRLELATLLREWGARE